MNAKLIKVYGIVQGVGFRPFVKRLADECGIRGSVENAGSFVKVYAEGSEASVDAFISGIRDRAPSRSHITGIEVVDSNEPLEFSGFTINESSFSGTGERVRHPSACIAPASGGVPEKFSYGSGLFIPPDIAVCDDCAQELYESGGRRYLHPFINCTLCGPRMSILENLPYDRERTSMKMFPMCRECSSEYGDPEDRRYDAQPVCCNDCGPVYRLLNSDLSGLDAIRRVREVILSGGIAAIKGIGGFHLCCSAFDEKAVQKLRERKHRPFKPFAVMFRDQDSVDENCFVNSEEEALLKGAEKPVVILRKKEGCQVADSVAPNNPTLGVMLPYAPIQLLLFRMDDGLDSKMPVCLVMTSGNLSDSPICRDDGEALGYLSRVADCILTHNREIRTRSDDSVTQIFEGKPYMIRHSRGFAPLPVRVGDFGSGLCTDSSAALSEPATGELPPVAAFGGDLKNSLCLNRGDMFYLSPYIGDMSDERSLRAHRETLDTMSQMLSVSPEAYVSDLHPGYASTMAAERMARETGIPLIKVQHHYAHILSCMAENSVDYDQRVIGVCFDGTGYGTDGTVWGGEILSCDYRSFDRISHVESFLQAGGDRAVREGWRIAVSLLGGWGGTKPAPLGEMGVEAKDAAHKLSLCTEKEYDALSAMLDNNINCVSSTSAGRLFDAASAILGIKRESTFEGEAASALQYRAQHFVDEQGFDKACAQAKKWGQEFDGGTRNLILRLASGMLSGTSPDELGFYFHYGLSFLTDREIRRTADTVHTDTVCLSGGVFQNTLFLTLLKSALQNDFRVLTHSLIPPNDNGIALGQCVFAAFNLSP